jgi:SAM-dependent methyltransferase
MYFNWNEDTIRWYINAEMYSQFYKKLADEIGPTLRGYKTLCDLGCGLGLFDFAVAPYVASIDCVDINETALSSVEDRARKLGLNTIHTRLEDSDTLAGKWDVVFMSFFGSRDLERYLPLCKKLIAVVAADSDTELFPRRERNVSRNTVENTIDYLDGNGVAYQLTRRTYEFGQPFTSREDAALFVQTYAPYASAEEADSFLVRHLVQTENQEFPLYIQRSKPVGIFELEGGLTCSLSS